VAAWGKAAASALVPGSHPAAPGPVPPATPATIVPASATVRTAAPAR
jgi:hypothetical protein